MGDDECPSCGQDYTTKVEVEVGNRWRDLMAGPPHTLFAKYVRVCPDPEDAQKARNSTQVSIDLYFHRIHDLRG